MGSRIAPSVSLGDLYVGDVVHKRLRPKPHALRYRVFSMLVDLDGLDALDEGLKVFSLNRFNLVSLYFKDFGPRDGSSLAKFIRDKAASAGVGNVARIKMLAYPRILGYAFNPITVYFCQDADDRTVFLVHEVSNTFGEHHFYETPVEEVDGEVRHEADKAFYVSPFNTMEGRYRFSVRPPHQNVFLGITLSTGEGGLLTAYFSGERRPLDDRMLCKLLLAYPLMTVKILAGIHWEALRLWLKGVPPTLGLRKAPRQASR